MTLLRDEVRAARSPVQKWIELSLLFGLGPMVLALGPRWLVSLGILAMGIFCTTALLLDPTFDRARLVRGIGAPGQLRQLLVRTGAVWIALFVATALWAPKPFFALPRARPLVWGLIMVLYPISAYAQEIAYRTFFFHRYGALFERPAARVAASGLLFGWAHVAVNSVLAMGLATVAGFIFASTYERSRSTVLVSLEHALYGDFVFTLGLGHLFYSSARWVTEAALRH